MKDSNTKFRILEGQGWTLENGIFKRNGFEIGFCHYYYTIKGRVQLDIAEEIYAHPVGRGDVRAG